MSALDDVLKRLEELTPDGDDVTDQMGIYAARELEALRAELKAKNLQIKQYAENETEREQGLMEQIAKLRELLKESEWAASNQEDCYCWCCHGQGWTETHAPDCALAEALKEGEE